MLLISYELKSYLCNLSLSVDSIPLLDRNEKVNTLQEKISIHAVFGNKTKGMRH